MASLHFWNLWNLGSTSNRAWIWRVAIVTVSVTCVVVVVTDGFSGQIQGAKLGMFDRASARDAMKYLSYLSGEWNATAGYYDSVGVNVEPLDSDLKFEFTPGGGSMIMNFRVFGILHGRNYEGIGSIFYDSKSGKFRKVWCDNFMNSPVVSSGELIDWNPGEQLYREPDSTVCLQTFTDDSSSVELLHRFGTDSAAFVVQDGRSKDSHGNYRSLSRFLLVKPR